MAIPIQPLYWQSIFLAGEEEAEEVAVDAAADAEDASWHSLPVGDARRGREALKAGNGNEILERKLKIKSFLFASFMPM